MLSEMAEAAHRPAVWHQRHASRACKDMPGKPPWMPSRLSVLSAHARSQLQEPKQRSLTSKKGIAAEHYCGFEADRERPRSPNLDCHTGQQNRKQRRAIPNLRSKRRSGWVALAAANWAPLPVHYALCLVGSWFVAHMPCPTLALSREIALGVGPNTQRLCLVCAASGTE